MARVHARLGAALSNCLPLGPGLDAPMEHTFSSILGPLQPHVWAEAGQGTRESQGPRVRHGARTYDHSLPAVPQDLPTLDQPTWVLGLCLMSDWHLLFVCS